MMQQFLAQQTLNLEVLYSFVIILCSLMIYFGTKELYELSSHKGIKYFRLAFLFFAIAYFFRSFIKFILVYFEVTELIRIPPQAFGEITLFVFMYFSLMAIFFLLYSVMWKKWNHEKKMKYLFHFMAGIIAILFVIFPNPIFYLLINLGVLAISIAIVLLARQNKRKSNYMYIAYILLTIFWTLNIIEIFTPNYLLDINNNIHHNII